MISLKFGRVSSTFLIFRNFPVVPPLQVQVTPVVPPLFWVKISKSYKICSYGSKIIFFIKEIVLDDFFKVWKGFKYFVNFSKFSCGPPFASASDACGPPFGFE